MIIRTFPKSLVTHVVSLVLFQSPRLIFNVSSIIYKKCGIPYFAEPFINIRFWDVFGDPEPEKGNFTTKVRCPAPKPAFR